MKRNFIKTIESSIKHWYVPLIVGALFVIIGIYTLVSPLESYVALAIVFSISFLVSGLSEIIFSISNRHEIDNWGWNLTFGIFTFLIGLLLVANPEISITTLPFYVGFLVLFRSIMGISFAIELKNYGILDWGNLMAISVLGVLFSFLLLWNPLFAGMTIVFWTGLALITIGIFSVLLSFKLKKLNTMPDKISQKLKNKYNDLRQEIQDELNKK
ncbi:MAG: HdeD family acid-resistance protein [Mangrovibacterium sp.]